MVKEMCLSTELCSQTPMPGPTGVISIYSLSLEMTRGSSVGRGKSLSLVECLPSPRGPATFLKNAASPGEEEPGRPGSVPGSAVSLRDLGQVP